MCDTVENIYKTWNEYCGDIINSEQLGNFKNHPNIEYMTEHDILHIFVGEWLCQINHKLKILNIKSDTAFDILLKNERIGGSKKNVNLPYGSCNANSVRYLNMALEVIIDLRDRDRNRDRDSVRFLEIGGGYGGFSLVLHELVKEVVGMEISEYIMIDIDNVLKLQKRYLEENGINTVRFIEANDIQNEVLEGDFYIFSSYSYSEIDSSIRRAYNDWFKDRGIIGGKIYWNTREVDLEGYEYKVELERPLTGKDNKIVTFYRVNEMFGRR